MAEFRRTRVPTSGIVFSSGTTLNSLGGQSVPTCSVGVQLRGFLCKAMIAARDHSATGSLAYYFMDWRHMTEILSAGQEVYTELLNLCVWAKSNGGMGSFYRGAHPLVFLFENGTGSHRNNVQLGKFGRNRTNVWNYPGANTFSRSDSEGNLLALHPTPKPVALIVDAIKDCTAIGDIVLDPFLGSGTAVVAAERSGRRCYGLELDPLYVDTIIRRWQKQTKLNAIHIETGETFNSRETQGPINYEQRKQEKGLRRRLWKASQEKPVPEGHLWKS